MRHTSRLKKRWIALLVLGLLFVVGLVALDPLVERTTRKGLALFEPRYVVSFENASLQLTRLHYVIEGLEVKRLSAGGDELPYLRVERLQVGVYWRELLHWHLVGTVKLDKPRLNLIAAKQEQEQQLDPKIPNLKEKLEALSPLKIDRIEILGAAMLFVDKTNKDFPKLWVHDVDATLENLATHAALARGEPTSVAVSGTIQETGELSVFLTADPLAQGLYFAGRANIAGFELNELSKAMASETGVTASQGTLDLFAEFDCRRGKLEGGVKPIMKNVKVVQGKPGVVNGVKAVLADAAVKVLSDRVGDRNAVATVVPLRGDLSSPDLHLWSAVIGVIRNAFVIGVSESYARLPPPGDDKTKNGPKAEPRN